MINHSDNMSQVPTTPETDGLVAEKTLPVQPFNLLAIDAVVSWILPKEGSVAFLAHSPGLAQTLLLKDHLLGLANLPWIGATGKHVENYKAWWKF